MKILFVSPEISPFAKTGGLADVAQALPKALHEAGHVVCAVMPLYGTVSQENRKLEDAGAVSVQTRAGLAGARVRKTENGPVPTYFIENEAYFDRDDLYGYGDWNFPDNLERFVFFCKAALETCRLIDFAPDIIHCNDWQTAALPALLRLTYQQYRRDPFFAHPLRIVFSIHNIAYQGLFPEDQWPVLCLPKRFYTYDFEFYGQINLMKSAVVFADAVHTVSETYAREIRFTEFGFGLQGLLQHHSHKLHGILNGVDTSEWNPETDPHLYGIAYSPTDLSGKKRVKARLQSEYHLPTQNHVPLIGLTARFVAQKGIDLVVRSAQRILAMGTQLIILGTGEDHYHDFFEWLRASYPGQVAIYIGFNNALAHKIIAGADMFLMPSHFEPCGLSQIYSLKYGTLPIVRLTGGLADTIHDGVNGFTFFDYNPDAFFHAVERAVQTYRHQPEKWRKMMNTAMRQDYSWRKSAKKMIELYQHITQGAPP